MINAAPRLASHSVVVGDERFTVAPKQTLLQAALAHGLNWPNGCRVGLCGSCRCRVTRGQVNPLGDFSLALDRRQLASGYVLACRSLVASDLTLTADHLLDGPPQAGDSAAKVVAVRPLTPLISELEVALENPYAHGYGAGQYARLSVPGQVPPRCFSFASASRGDDRLHFHIRHFSDGQFSRWLLASERADALLQVSRPLGEFTLTDTDHRQLFFAGGSGLAPILAMLEELTARPHRPPAVRVVYAARDQQHLYAQGTLAALAEGWPEGAFEFIPVLSREPADSGWSGLRGHLFDHLRGLGAGFETADTYLCGPPGLIDALQLYLLKGGWQRQQLFADRFLPAF